MGEVWLGPAVVPGQIGVTFALTVPEVSAYQNKGPGCGKRLPPLWLPLKQTELSAFNPEGELHHEKQPS